MAATSKTVEEKPELDREALADEAWDQLVAYRADVVSHMQRFGTGASRWADKGWEWKTPDWDISPEEWPPLAKMLYLFARIDAALVRANFARHFSRPSYCPQCIERPTTVHGVWLCVEHTDWVAATKQLAAAVFPEARGL